MAESEELRAYKVKVRNMLNSFRDSKRRESVLAGFISRNDVPVASYNALFALLSLGVNSGMDDMHIVNSFVDATKPELNRQVVKISFRVDVEILVDSKSDIGNFRANIMQDIKDRVSNYERTELVEITNL